MDRVESSDHPDVFFASRMDPLIGFRSEVHGLGKVLGRTIWVSEHSAPELETCSDDEIQVACLRMVRSSRHFFCVLDGGYGSAGRWGHADVSLLELELFMAALTGKPIQIFLLKPFNIDPRLSSLLNAIKVACPGALDEVPKSELEIKEKLTRLLDKDQDGRKETKSFPGKVIGLLVQYLARVRSLGVDRSMYSLDVRFLDGRFAPIYDQRPDKDFIAHLIHTSDSFSHVPAKLAKLWVAIRYLGVVPYSSRENKDFLPLWNAALSRWASSSAWYGLHGHIFLGRLAAVNTILDLQQSPDVKSGAIVIENSIQGSYGAIASEYYSIAKIVPSRRWKKALLENALGKIEVALKVNSSDISGLLSIRGAVRMALGKSGEALEDYKIVLKMRMEAGESIGRIGEAEARLGFAYFRRGRIKQAQQFLESGVAHLEGSDRPEFSVRAMRYLSLFYALTFRRSQALNVLERAFEIADKNELQGQLLQIQSLSRVLFHKNLD